jgi:plastocyanin
MPQTHSIEITAMRFPADTPVAKGDTVVWTNKMGMPHTVTADNGAFDSGRLTRDKSFYHVFDAAGQVAYHCDIHPSMTGTVTVG